MARTTITRSRPSLLSLFSSKRCQLAWLLLLMTQSGCTSPRDFFANGFKVGPNYKEPPTPVADDWIEAEGWNKADANMPYMQELLKPDPNNPTEKRLTVAEKLKDMSAKSKGTLPLTPEDWIKAEKLAERKPNEHIGDWWTTFNDPMLNKLVCLAYHGNYSLRQAGYQVLAARAQLGISIGNFLPQSQNAYADFMRNSDSTQTAFSAFIPQRFFSQFDYNFNLAWELDLWGKFRRAIENSQDTLDASVFNYDDILVTLVSDVATYYVNIRTFEERIRYARMNVIEQQKAVEKVAARLKVGVANQLDLDQVRAVLYQTAATIPQLEIGLRVANNQLCVALGLPPDELRVRLGVPPNAKKPIPYAPPEVAVSIPADLLRRRPDVRMAERQAAAQCAEIGFAEADFYPHVSLVGNFGWSAAKFRNLFNQDALTGSIGPQVDWNLLQYGRILNNMRTQDANFQSLVAQYQNTVLVAQQEVENGLVTFLKTQQAAKMQEEAVKSLVSAHSFVLAQYEAGLVDISQLVLILQNLATQQDALAVFQGQIATGLIQVYKAMGGGWELRETGCTLPDGCAPGPDPTEPMRQRGHFLPYPRVLKESTLPIYDGGVPVNVQATPVANQPDGKAADSTPDRKASGQPFPKAQPVGQEGKTTDGEPIRLPESRPISLPIQLPPSAEIGIPQLGPPVPETVGPSNPVEPVEVSPPPGNAADPASLPTLEPIVPILPRIPG